MFANIVIRNIARAHEADVPHRAPVLQQPVFLKHGGRAPVREAVDHAGVGRHEAQKDIQKRGLARAGAALDGDDAPIRQLERQAGKHRLAIEAFREVFDDDRHLTHLRTIGPATAWPRG